MFQDISDRKQMEKKLENAKIAARNVLEDLSAEKLRAEIAQAKEEAILLSIGEGLIATDEKGDIVLINKTAEKLLDVKSEEVMGKSIDQVIPIEDERGMPVPPESRPVNMALAGRCDRCHAAPGINYYYARKDKTKFPVASMVTPVILDGKVIGAIEVFRDVTREREIDKTKTEFVSIASHQLRTPLSSVSWHAEMLLTGDVGKLNKEQKKIFKRGVPRQSADGEAGQRPLECFPPRTGNFYG
jgi:PAS domain S-box